MGKLLDWREEIFENRARAEVDLGVDLHAGDELQLAAVAFKAAASDPKEPFNVMLCSGSGQ